MSKVTVDFYIHDEDGNVINTIKFQSVEEIDDFIETLQEVRAEFEHRIEVKKQKMREKRKRRKEKLRNESGTAIGDMENSYKEFMDCYNQIPEPLKTLLKPAVAAVTELVEAARKKNGK